MAEVTPEAVAVPKKSTGIGRILAILAIGLLLVGVVVAVGVAIYLGVQWNDTTQRLDQTKADLTLVQRTLEKKIATLEDTTAQLTQSQADLKSAQDQITAINTELDTTKGDLASYKGWHDATVCKKTMALDSYEFAEDLDRFLVYTSLATYLIDNDLMKVFNDLQHAWYDDPDENGFFSITIEYKDKAGKLDYELFAFYDGSKDLEGVFWATKGCWAIPPALP